MKNEICLNSNTYHGFSLDDAINGAAKAGYRYIELAAVRGYTEHLRSEMSDAELDEVKAKLKAHSIECLAIAGHSNLMTAEGIEAFRNNIELTRRMGCNIIVTGTGETHDDADVIEDDEVLLNNIGPVLSLCEQYGITIVIETHGNNYATGQSIKRLVEKSGSANLAINYDTANCILYADTMPYEDLEASADKVKWIHLKDKIGGKGLWNFPAIGDGEIDFAKVFRILQKTECTVPLSVEVEFTSAGPANLEEVDEATIKSFNEVKRLMSSLQEV